MKLHLVYGSETGTAEGLIKLINSVLLRLNKTLSRPVETEIFSCDEFIPKLTGKEEIHAIIITSSTWDGDPPENAIKFQNKLIELEGLGKENTSSHISFALLGLGDRGYEKFGKFPKFIYEKLLKLGANPKFRFETADDEEGAYLTIEPWIDDIIKFIKSWNSGTVPDNVYTDLKSAAINPIDLQTTQSINESPISMLNFPGTPERVSLEIPNSKLSKSLEKPIELKSWLFDKFKFIWAE